MLAERASVLARAPLLVGFEGRLVLGLLAALEAERSKAETTSSLRNYIFER